MTGDSVLASDEFQKPPGVRGVLDRELQHDFNYYTGGLPCESGRKAAGRWHRDTASLFDDQRVEY